MDTSQKDFEILVREYESTIYSICYMYADKKAEVDDLMQESLTNLWRSLSSFKGGCSINSWIYRVTLNTCISYKRKKRIKTEPLDFETEIFDSDTNVGRQSKLLHDRISHLEVIDRAIVLLWLENMSYDEIGAIVGMNAKNIGVRLVRIKEKLKNISVVE